MENSTLKALIGIDSSLIGTQFHVMYGKGEGGYVVLLIPLEQTPDNGIFVKDLTGDIESMARGVTDNNTAVDTTQPERTMTEAAKEDGSASMKLENTVIKLQMAYLYICKKGENLVLEYTLQLQVVTEGLALEAIKPIVDVMNLPVSVRNTDRKKVVDKMALITVGKRLDVAALPDKGQAAK